MRFKTRKICWSYKIAGLIPKLNHIIKSSTRDPMTRNCLVAVSAAQRPEHVAVYFDTKEICRQFSSYCLTGYYLMATPIGKMPSGARKASTCTSCAAQNFPNVAILLTLGADGENFKCLFCNQHFKEKGHLLKHFRTGRCYT